MMNILKIKHDMIKEKLEFSNFKISLTFVLISWFFTINFAIAQTDFEFTNKVYSKDIFSIQTLVNGTIKSLPMLVKNSNDILLIQFDDLVEDENKNYYYRIIHCDRNWNPSNITEVEYIDGYNNDIIRNWEFSATTKVNYTHYFFQIPNKDTKLKISGNYLLLVYDKGNDSKPVFSRRFMVVENNVKPFVAIVRPMEVSNLRYNHQLNISVNMGQNKIANPQRDVFVNVVQNGNWDNAKIDLKPVFISNNVLTFDNFGAISFKALTEYRSFDMRRIQSRGRNVAGINFKTTPNEVFLKVDEPKPYSTYSFNFDFNGNYYVDNWDYTDPKIRDFVSNLSYFEDSIQQTFITRNELLDGEYQVSEKDLRADYNRVFFSLKSDEVYNSEVYVYGAFTNWLISPEFKMKYNATEGMYEANALLKQGYYDYMYAAVDKKNVADFAKIEGSWAETENDYTTLVYLSEFGSRYDRIIGYATSISR